VRFSSFVSKNIVAVSVVALGVVLFLSTLWRGAVNPDQSDFTTYYYATKGALSLPFKHPYSNLSPLFPFFYPPGALVFFRPLNLLPYSAAVFVWALVSFAAFAAGLFLLFKSLEKIGWGFSRGQRALLFLALSLFYPLKFTILAGQANTIIFFCLVAAFYFYLREQDHLAGLSLAIGTILKISPALLLVYFLTKRRWKIFLWGAFFVALFSLGAELGVWWDQSINWYYLRRVVHHTTDQGGAHWRDQSLLSFLRLFQRFFDGIYSRFFESFLGSKLSGVRFYSLVNYALVGLATLPLLWFSFRSPSKERAGRCHFLEYSLLVLLGVGGTGLCWFHQYTILLLPLLVGLAAALHLRSGAFRAVILGLLAAIYLVWAVNLEPYLSQQGYEPRVLTSVMFYGAVALVGILFYLWRRGSKIVS